ncbi:MAG TPA: hypothetical protein VFV41_17540 [Streptosporangiaceae bacterium]|nr:hypothetical protein [Streptosporangiaceae bacterium]
MDLTIVNPDPRYPRATLIEPPATGYLLLAAVVAAPLGRTPLRRRSPRKTALLAELKTLAAGVERLPDVTKATVYRAALVPPLSADARRMARHPAQYDVVVLVETTAGDAAAAVADSPELGKLRDALQAASGDVFAARARCVRAIGDVDKSRPGLFLFNFFVAEDREVALELWDHLAGWYAVETGLDNSTLLSPLDSSDYTCINHARWDMSLPRFAARQFGKRSFFRYVLRNMQANGTAAMPILYRLA